MTGSAITISPARVSRVRRAASLQQPAPTGTGALSGARYHLHLLPGLVALCAGVVLVGAVALAEDGGSVQPINGPTAQADQGIGTLLRQVTRQLTAGQMLAPEGNNALDTWLLVGKAASPASPATKSALTNFAADARKRAADEQALGHILVATSLFVFADEAIKLLSLESTKPASSLADAQPTDPAATVSDTLPPALPTDMATHDASASETPTRSAQFEAPTEPWRSKIGLAQTPIPAAESGGTTIPVALEVPNKEAIIQAPAASKAKVAAAVPALPSSVPTTAQQQAAAAAFASRGDAMLSNQDIAAARLFYEYAAKAGSARAAIARAETYDPAVLKHLGVVGTRPDPSMAADWYRKAAALGSRRAEIRLETVGAEAAK